MNLLYNKYVKLNICLIFVPLTVLSLDDSSEEVRLTDLGYFINTHETNRELKVFAAVGCSDHIYFARHATLDSRVTSDSVKY